jgi:hypothetical protein
MLLALKNEGSIVEGSTMFLTPLKSAVPKKISVTPLE